ncbi:mannonate dehydratase [Escherichia coli]
MASVWLFTRTIRRARSSVLPRIVSTIEDMQWMVDTVNSMANGFTMCTGSYGVRADNDLVDMIKAVRSAYLLHPSALHHA